MVRSPSCMVVIKFTPGLLILLASQKLDDSTTELRCSGSDCRRTGGVSSTFAVKVLTVLLPRAERTQKK